MARTYHHGKRSRRSPGKQVRIKAIKREKPDLKRLSRAIIALAQAELEKEAQDNAKRTNKRKRGSK